MGNKINLFRQNNFLLVLIIFLFLIINSHFVLTLVPNGANWTFVNTSTAPPDAPRVITAQAGNVTELNIYGYSTTKTWQGYFGNVSGTIQLADGADRILYNWSAASPMGEIYAANESFINWSGISCFNYTETGDMLERDYNINETDSDGINETFSWNTGHDLFYTGAVEFSSGECMSTRLYNSGGIGNFEEVILWDGDSIIFASLLKRDAFGFDNRTHDFEMMVLEDGHGTNINPTNYYFYIELQ